MSWTDPIYQMHADTCKALAHPLRIAVIDSLADSELSFTSLCERTGAAKPNLSQHLSLMMANGLLLQRKQGQAVYYRLSSPDVANACRLMRSVLIESTKRRSSVLANVGEAP